MSCPSLETLDRYVRDTLAEAERAEIAGHCAACEGCARRTEEIRANVELERELAARPAHAETRAASEPAPAGAGSGVAADSVPATHFETTLRIQGYQLVRELSRGGQGVVYQAIQKSTKRKVAVKVLRDGHFAHAGERARFEREVQILGQLKHSNIISIYDSGTLDGHAYYVMDYVPGQPIDEYVRARQETAARELRFARRGHRRSRATEETLRLFAKVCDAVHVAHLRGIIHRDLKPSNIRVDTDGEPRVLDFGLAKLAGAAEFSQSPAMTMTGQFLGSLPWSSPEQAEGVPSKIDIRTDVYSLGVMLFQLLTGGFPYDVTGNMRDVLDRILRSEPPRPSTLQRQIDDELDTIVLKCLSKDRDRRYQSAGELGRDIRHYLAGEPIVAKRDSGFYVLRKALRRHWRATAAAGTIAALIVAGCVISLVLLGQAQRDNRRALATMAFLERVLTMPGKGSAGDAGRAPDQRPPRYERRRQGRGEPPGETELPREQRPPRDTRRRSRPGGPPGSNGVRADERPAPAEGRGPGRDGRPGLPRPRGRSFEDVLDGAVAALDRGELSQARDAEGRVRLILGRAYLSLGSYDSAEEQLTKAGDIAQSIEMRSPRLLADSLHELGDLKWQQNELQEAEKFARDALRLRETAYGEDSPPVARTLTLLASIHWRNLALDEAMQLMSRALPIFERQPQDFLGHSDALVTQGLIRESRGELDEAQQLYERAAAVAAQADRGPPFAITSAQINAARIATMRRDFEGAAHLLEEAFGKLEGLPVDVPEMLWLRFQRAELRLAQGDPQEALRILDGLVADAEGALGPEDPDVALFLRSRAVALVELGRLDEAEADFRESRKIYEIAWPQRKEVIANASSLLGDCLRRQGAFGEAEALLVAAHEELVSTYRNYYFSRLQESCQRIVALYMAWETAEPGKGFAAKAATWQRKLAALEAAAKQ